MGMEKGALGKYQEDIHTPLQERYASGSLMEDGTVRPNCLSKKGDYSLQLFHIHMTKSSKKPFIQGQI